MHLSSSSQIWRRGGAAIIVVSLSTASSSTQPSSIPTARDQSSKTLVYHRWFSPECSVSISIGHLLRSGPSRSVSRSDASWPLAVSTLGSASGNSLQSLVDESVASLCRLLSFYCESIRARIHFTFAFGPILQRIEKKSLAIEWFTHLLTVSNPCSSRMLRQHLSDIERWEWWSTESMVLPAMSTATTSKTSLT